MTIGTASNNIWTNLDTEEILSRFNDQDVKIPHSGYHRVSLLKDSNQSIVKDTWTDLSFNNEVYDIGTLHDNITNNERVALKKAGCYIITFQVEWDGKENDPFKTRVLRNGASPVKSFTVIAGKDGIVNNTGTIIIDLLDTDYLTLQGLHNSVSNKDVYSFSNVVFSI